MGSRDETSYILLKVRKTSEAVQLACYRASCCKYRVISRQHSVCQRENCTCVVFSVTLLAKTCRPAISSEMSSSQTPSGPIEVAVCVRPLELLPCNLLCSAVGSNNNTEGSIPSPPE